MPGMADPTKSTVVRARVRDIGALGGGARRLGLAKATPTLRGSVVEADAGLRTLLRVHALTALVSIDRITWSVRGGEFDGRPHVVVWAQSTLVPWTVDVHLYDDASRDGAAIRALTWIADGTTAEIVEQGDRPVVEPAFRAIAAKSAAAEPSAAMTALGQMIRALEIDVPHPSPASRIKRPEARVAGGLPTVPKRPQRNWRKR